MTGDAVEAALVLLRDLLDDHGPACVCGQCGILDEATAALDALVGVATIARAELSEDALARAHQLATAWSQR